MTTIPVPAVLLGLLLLAAPAVWGYMYVQADIKARAAYASGITAGRAQIEATEVEEAAKTTTAIRNAQINPPVIPTDKAALQKLCNKDVHCRDRGK